MHLFRAKDRNRTYDRLITNQLLYQLSYFGKWTKFSKILGVLSIKIKHLRKKNCDFFFFFKRFVHKKGLQC